MKNLLQILAVALISATAFSQTARVQVIHNSADAAAAEVDVYVDAANAIDNFAFRTATAFLDLPAGVEIELSIAPGNSASVADALLTVPVTLTENETYIVIADGIVSGTGYDPAPPLGLQIYAMGREAASDPANVDVLVHHGSTDAPTVDVVETGVGAGTIVDDISYTEYQGYLELPTADYVLEIRDETGATGVAAFSAPLATLTLDGAALVVVASGFLDPSQNSNGPAFGLFAASPLGGALLELPSAPLGVDDFDVTSFAIYPNPATDRLSVSVNGLDLADYTIAITDMLGRTISQNNLRLVEDTINISSLRSGVYQLSIMDGSTVIGSKKFLKR